MNNSNKSRGYQIRSDHEFVEARFKEIQTRRLLGWSFARIGKELGISRQRVHQIISERKGK